MCWRSRAQIQHTVANDSLLLRTFKQVDAMPWRYIAELGPATYKTLRPAGATPARLSAVLQTKGRFLGVHEQRPTLRPKYAKTSYFCNKL